MGARLRVGSERLLAEARSRIDRIDAMSLFDERDAVIVDIRDSGDRRREGWIPGSIWIPRNVLEWRVDPDAEVPDPRLADPSLQLVVVCNEGYQSSLAAATLRSMGHDRARDLVGGHRAWVAAGLPVETAED